jgi:hypothetical protein
MARGKTMSIEDTHTAFPESMRNYTGLYPLTSFPESYCPGKVRKVATKVKR